MSFLSHSSLAGLHGHISLLRCDLDALGLLGRGLGLLGPALCRQSKGRDFNVNCCLFARDEHGNKRGSTTPIAEKSAKPFWRVLSVQFTLHTLQCVRACICMNVRVS